MSATAPAPDPVLILDCSILLVHDGKAASEDPWAVLARQGYRLLHARDAAGAVEIFSRHNDIAVVIIDLADANGLSLLRSLQAQGGDAVEYILACDRDAPDLSGVDCLTRPLGEDRLTAAVSDAYNVARMQRFRLAEMQALEKSLAQFQAQTQAAMAQLIARAQKGAGEPGTAPALPDTEMLGPFITEELRRARLREKLFGTVALRHSGWMLVLVLAEAQAGDSELTIKGAAYSAGLPLSSALRTINDMCAGGLIARWGDAKDARRSFVTLTPLGRSQFARYAAAFPQAGERRLTPGGA